MDLVSLRYVITLAEELHFGRAAQRHYIVPQAFGRHVQRLEQELGVRLFDRTSRTVEVTAAGAAFIIRARQVLAMADGLSQTARESPPADSSVLRIGVLGYGMADCWPDVRDLMAAQCPGVALDHVDVDYASQYDAVWSGEVDVAVGHGVGPAPGLTLEKVLEVPLVAVVPVRSAYADAQQLTPQDVAGAGWVKMMASRNHGQADWAGLTTADGRPGPVVRTPAAIPAAVATSGHLGLHGEPASRFFARPDVRFIPFDGTPTFVSLVTRESDTRPAVQAFCRAARTAVQARRTTAIATR
jgi:DNA-binding transcriptional LysR family regulator